MGSLKSRLKALEGHSKGHKTFANNYPDLVTQVRAEAEVDIEMGVEPDFYVDDTGLVRAAFDGRIIHHIGEQAFVMHEHEKELEREIVVLGHDPKAEPEEDLEELERWYEEYKRRVNERLDEWGERGLRSEGT
jgi:hypothetical protein